MRIALVRGPFLNLLELQTYMPLTERNDFTAVGADWLMYARPEPGPSWRLAQPHLWAAASGRFDPRLPVLLNRLRSWTMGESFALGGLDEAVRGAEILHSVETYSTMTYQCLQIRERRPCKVVATVWENLPGMGEKHPRRRWRKKGALRELDGFLAPTETSRRALLEDGAPDDRIEVIPMAVDLARFKPLPPDHGWRQTWGLSPEEKVVLFVGRLVEEKGVRELLKAIPEVLARVRAPTRFCFAGAGPLESDIRAAAGRWGNIHLMPFVPYGLSPTLHNMADVFVLPSKPAPKWQEQFGFVLVESMACGKPIVTTRSGSIPDVVGEAALLLPPGDAPALAAAICDLLESEPARRRLADLALARARQHFDARKNAALIEAFYKRILGRSS